jgi:two-component system CheB/CheR fusion protein
MPMQNGDEAVRPLVVLGSSAGGLEAVGAVLERLSTGFPAPVIVAQHLDPTRPSHLAAILGRRTALPVSAVEAKTALEPGHVYVVPPDRQILIGDGSVEPTEDGAHRPTPSIDLILRNAAQAYGEGCVAVILSGLGSDGAAGARDVKAHGGMVVIQNPDTAAHASMPQAIPPSVVDIVADADAIGPLLVDLLTGTPGLTRANDERLLRGFIDQLRERTGIDFASYKRGTILRRLQRRMTATNSARLRDYLSYVGSHPEEYQRLTSSFLIKVTEFFRDPELYDALRDEVLPRLIDESHGRENELRFWSAGCATGEEAYSIAMLVADALGDQLSQYNVRVFATDVDLDAIAFARRGVYSTAMVEGVPPQVRERHFNNIGDGQWEIKKHIRALTVFGQHDLGHRAPFPRVDLALCRNVLIYFTPDLQKRALQLFAFALRDGGYLVLGKAESTTPLAQYFVLENARAKVYRRQGERVLIPPARIRDTSPLMPVKLPVSRRASWTDDRSEHDRAGAARMERSEQLLLRVPVGIIVVNRTYDVQSVNSMARQLLGIHGPALGDDLVHIIGGESGNEIRDKIDAVFREETPAPLLNQRVQVSGEDQETRTIEISAHPGPADGSGKGGETCVLLVRDVTAWVSDRDDLRGAVQREADELIRLADQVRSLAHANTSLVRSNEELTTVNSDLRNANEELLVANEEVQAATEEVETLNEELQATNEELETLNEELQATVEELNATNDDLEARTTELQEIAAAAEELRNAEDGERRQLLAILDAIDDPVLVVDAEGRTVKANQPFHRLVGDPEALDLRTAAGESLDGAGGLGSRAMRERFELEVLVGGRSFRVSGRPINGHDRPYGALIFRAATATLKKTRVKAAESAES